jgi:hypothetical protein
MNRVPAPDIAVAADSVVRSPETAVRTGSASSGREAAARSDLQTTVRRLGT